MEIRVQEHSAHIVIVTIENQPSRNAMTRQMMAELAAVWDRLEHSPVRCIILTGASERAFSAGADMRGDLSADPEMARTVNHALLKHHPFSKPIIAAVNGFLAPFGDMTLWNILASGVVIPYISPYPRVTNLMLGGHILSVAPKTLLMEGGDRFHRDTSHDRPCPLVARCDHAAPRGV